MASPKRRKPGTGSIRHKPGRDQPWEAAFPIGRGRARYDYFATRAEAEGHLDKLTAERDHATAPRNIAGGSQRVDAFLESWLTIKRPHLRPNSVHVYTYMAELAIEYIGSMRLDSVRREDIDRMLNDLAAKGLKSAGYVRTVLFQAFRYAVDEDYIIKNPAQRAKAPPVEKRVTAVLTAEERERMLATAADVDEWHTIKLLPIWHLYSRCGLRRGEALGLKWSDVDLTARTITIRRQYIQIRGQCHLSDPKTKRSARSIPIPAQLADLLATHKAIQSRFAAAHPETWKLQGFVFTNETGSPVSPYTVVSRWAELRRVAQINPDVPLHGLRHTAQFLLEQAGTPTSILMALMGHTTVQTSLLYSDHAKIEDIRRAMGD